MKYILIKNTKSFFYFPLLLLIIISLEPTKIYGFGPFMIMDMTNTGTCSIGPVIFSDGVNGTSTYNANSTSVNITLSYSNATFESIINITSLSTDNDYFIKLHLKSIENASNFEKLIIKLFNSSNSFTQINISDQNISQYEGEEIILNKQQNFEISAEEIYIYSSDSSILEMDLIVRVNSIYFYYNLILIIEN